MLLQVMAVKLIQPEWEKAHRVVFFSVVVVRVVHNAAGGDQAAQTRHH